jgi:hypothetical protein
MAGAVVQRAFVGGDGPARFFAFDLLPGVGGLTFGS